MDTDVIDVVAQRLESIATPARVYRDHPIGPMTTYRVGGPAALMVEVAHVEELIEIATAIDGQLPVLTIGLGSNMLVSDVGFPGVALRLGEGFDFIDVEDETVIAGGATSLPVLARRTVAASLTGFEWAVGVPGSVGGAVRMNAGGHGSDMAASLTSAIMVDLTSGAILTPSADDLAFAYRTSAVRDNDCVVSATMQLQFGDRERSEAELSEIVRWRREHQPGGQNAGSVFTNPQGDSAGRLIDAAGCKGLRCGSAEVSTKHANFIQADDGGSADDVHELMQMIIARIQVSDGIVLHPETRLVGFATDTRDDDAQPAQGEGR